jgi:hypothetical protein
MYRTCGENANHYTTDAVAGHQIVILCTNGYYMQFNSIIYIYMHIVEADYQISTTHNCIFKIEKDWVAQTSFNLSLN